MKRDLKNRLKRAGAMTTSLLNLQLSRQTNGASVRNLVSRLVPHDLGVPLRRIGGTADGGYLVPDDLDGIAHCFSPGVADTADFECGLYDLGIPSFLADYSVSGPPAVLPECDFVKKFVGAVNSDTTMTLDDWINQKSPDPAAGDLLLQMDIESAEYETILATSPETLSRFRIIVLELHKLGHLNNPLFFQFVDAAMAKLLDQFEVAHLHANNAVGLTPIAGIDVPRVAELTLLRKDRVVNKQPLNGLPHPLDEPNVRSRKDVQLPDYWWNAGKLRSAA